MDTVLTRAGDAPVARPSPSEASGITGARGRLLLTMAQSTAERVVLPQRDPPPPDWYRFPLP
jgi:hypothetical protein